MKNLTAAVLLSVITFASLSSAESAAPAKDDTDTSSTPITSAAISP